MSSKMSEGEGDNFQNVIYGSVISSSSTNHGVLCDCNKEAKIARSWTRDNPGCRFFGCKVRRVGSGYDKCNLFRWVDVEKPHGWQYLALLEARDMIREQKEEIANLRNKVRPVNNECSDLEISSKMQDKLELKEKIEECEALKREVLILSQRSSVLRSVLVASSVGFVLVLGGIIVMTK